MDRPSPGRIASTSRMPALRGSFSHPAFDGHDVAGPWMAASGPSRGKRRLATHRCRSGQGSDSRLGWGCSEGRLRDPGRQCVPKKLRPLPGARPPALVRKRPAAFHAIRPRSCRTRAKWRASSPHRPGFMGSCVAPERAAGCFDASACGPALRSASLWRFRAHLFPWPGLRGRSAWEKSRAPRPGDRSGRVFQRVLSAWLRP